MDQHGLHLVTATCSSKICKTLSTHTSVLFTVWKISKTLNFGMESVFFMKNWNHTTMPLVHWLQCSKCLQTFTKRVKCFTNLEWSSRRQTRFSKPSVISRTRSLQILSLWRERVTLSSRSVSSMKNKMISYKPLENTKQPSLEIRTTTRFTNILPGALSASPKSKKRLTISRTLRTSIPTSRIHCTLKVDAWWPWMITREL